jgi:hypothetical protein
MNFFPLPLIPLVSGTGIPAKENHAAAKLQAKSNSELQLLTRNKSSGSART